MEKYNNLELSVLSCILQKPKLIEKTILKDEHFKKHYKIWQFMKAFYKKFGNFDLTLMMSISKNKYRMIEYIMWMLDKEPTTALFNEYEKQLIDEFNEQEKDKWIINKIYELSNDLLMRSITTNDFKIKVNDIYSKANEIFKEEK